MYLKATQDMLHSRVAGERYRAIYGSGKYKKNQWISRSTIERNEMSKIEIGDHSVIGRHCEIKNGVKIEESSIGSSCWIGEGTVITGSVVMDFTNIGKNVQLNNCIVGEYAVIEDNCVVDGDMPIEFSDGLKGAAPVIGGEVTLLEGSIIGSRKRVAPIHESHRIFSTGKFVDLGYDSNNVYFIEKI